MPVPTRVLLIDDDAVDRAGVRRALKLSSLNYELVEAVDGVSGLATARVGAFDCVLLDFRLPDVDTFELLASLLAPEGGRQAVIMLTGEADQELALRLMRAGALDYLSKTEASPSNLARAIRYARARRHFLAELEAARDEAEQKSHALDSLNRQKTLLLSIIAHDLRNPFQALLGLAQSLSRAVADKDPTSIERRAQGIHEAARQAHALMESLFSWASLQMDSRAVALGPVALEPVAAEIVSISLEKANDKGIELVVDCGGLAVLGQRDMIATVLRNLVGNAVKFTLPGGRVEILARELGDTVAISVTDTGVGMTPERVADLFNLDHRTTTVGTAGERGGGLGLLLCRDLVELQGGELSATSAPSEGATFRFSLRKAAVVEIAISA